MIQNKCLKLNWINTCSYMVILRNCLKITSLSTQDGYKIAVYMYDRNSEGYLDITRGKLRYC